MLLNAALVVSLGLVIYGLWKLSGFMDGGAKAGRIFFLTTVSGLCLIANVIFPFLLASVIVSLMELRTLISQA